LLKRYLKYLFSSRTRYKVHSPFVFDLINKVLRQKPNLNYLSDYVETLKKDSTIIKVCDHGAGSRKSTSNKRKVNDIFKTSSSSPQKADLIKRICEFDNDAFTCLELGTNLGVATFAISSSNHCSKIVSIEGCPNIFHYSKKKLKLHENIEIINSTFDEKIEYLLENHQPTIIYIDGNHTKEATLKYFEIIAQHHCVEPIIFDDINWSAGMLDAWQQIIKTKKFNVSINLFRLGLLYKREGQKKEAFTIRY